MFPTGKPFGNAASEIFFVAYFVAYFPPKAYHFGPKSFGAAPTQNNKKSSKLKAYP
jgi:hypothetical protein